MVSPDAGKGYGSSICSSCAFFPSMISADTALRPARHFETALQILVEPAKLLRSGDHGALLRLPTWIFYAQGVKAKNRFERPETERFRGFESRHWRIARICRAPEVLAREILEDLEAAVALFEEIAQKLER